MKKNNWSVERIKKIIKSLSIEYIKVNCRLILRDCILRFSHLYIKIFLRGGKDLEYIPYESDVSGYINQRSPERILECRILYDKVNEWKRKELNIIEVGAVSPYYFPELIDDVLDCYDTHERVNHRIDLFDFDFKGWNVISISTIEHVGTGDYGIEVRRNAVDALKKLLEESNELLVTYPVGYNKCLDDFVYKHQDEFKTTVYKRGRLDNNFKKTSLDKCRGMKYSFYRYADAIVIIEKCKN